MATFAGKGGAVKIGANTVAEIDTWDLSINADLNETTKFGDAAKGFLPGVYEWNGTFKGRLDTTDTNGQAAIQTAILAGTSVALKLFVDTTKNYNGTAFLKTMSPKASVAGTADADFSFQGSGALTFTP